jgi:hypothetical protein
MLHVCGKEEVCTGFWWENLRERDSWRDPGGDERMIFSRVSCGDMDWIELAQDRQVAGTCECGNLIFGFRKIRENS